METKLVYGKFNETAADAIAMVLFEDQPAPPDLSNAAQWIDELRTSGEFTGKPGELTVQHRPQGMAAKRLVFVGLGKLDKFSAAELRKAVGAAVRTLKQKGVKTLAWWIGGLNVNAPAFTALSAETIVEGALLGNYEPDVHKTSSDAKSLDEFHVVCAKEDASVDQAFERGKLLGECQNFARQMANEPANLMTPTKMADEAMAMAGRIGPRMPDPRRRAHAGAWGWASLLGVAQGSAEPPALIIIRYKPARADSKPIIWPWSAKASPSIPADLHQARRGHGKDEVRYVRRRGRAWAPCAPSLI